MVWTDPRTWTVGQVVTAAQLNTHLRDNLNFLRSFHGCRIYKSATQTVASGTTDVISFNTEDFDTDGLHDNATNNSRITIPAGFGGYWHFVFEADIDADNSFHNGVYQCRLRKNAAGSDLAGTFLQGSKYAGHANNQNGLVQVTIPLAATDYVEAFFQSTVEGRVLQSGVAGTVLTAFYLGL